MNVVRWFFVLLLLPSFARAEDDAQFAAKAQAIPSDVETVASGGYWTRDGHDGSFRLIIQVAGWDDLYNRVFLQWIRLDPDKQQEIVERTVPIKEIAGRWRIVSQKFVFHGQRSDIVLSAERRIPEAKATFTITPAADFSYTITTSEK